MHPQRDIVVGGGGKLMIAGKEFAPGAYDYLAPAIVAFQKRSEPPSDPAGALHAPIKAGHVRGQPPGYVMRTSAYTRATLHPIATTAGLIGLGLAALTVGGIGKAAGRTRRGSGRAP